MNKSLTIGLAVIVALAFVALALVYWSHPANELPHWLPGYDAKDTAVHVKHGIAALLLAIAAGIFAWFQGGPKQPDTSAK